MKKLLLVFAVFAIMSVSVFAKPACSPTSGSGAIWTTNGDCGDESQDVNHFDVGDVVYINGACFEATEYDWAITGQPGGASSDPNIEVAGGKYTVDDSYNFCFEAYTIQPGDDGEYTVDFGKKNDNYRVEEVILPVCGNGKVELGEDCETADDCYRREMYSVALVYDHSPTYECVACACEEVTEPYCGDGFVDAGEECDDGNKVDDDACSNKCKIKNDNEVPEFGVIGAGLALAGIGLVVSRRRKN